MPLFSIVSEIYGLKSRNGENIGWNNRPVLSACNDGELRNRFVPHSAWRILQGMKLNLCNAAFWMYTISTNDRPRSAANFIAIDFVLVIQSHSCTAVCCMCRPRATPGARNAVWIVYVCDCVSNYLNPLMGTLRLQFHGPSYSNTVILVHWPLMGGLLHLVAYSKGQGGAWAGCGPA